MKFCVHYHRYPGYQFAVILDEMGLKAKAFIVFFSAFVPCVINAYTGIRQTSPALINVGKVCGASNFTIFRKIGIPSAMTMTFAGIRVALGNAWATLVGLEMLELIGAWLYDTARKSFCKTRYYYSGYRGNWYTGCDFHLAIRPC